MTYNRLKELRLQAHKTQEEIAHLLGISYQAYAHYEKNRRDPSPEQLLRLSDFYGVTVDYLLEHNEITPKEKALGVGRRAIYLSEDEFDWLELRSEVIRTKGEDYLKTLITMIEAVTKT